MKFLVDRCAGRRLAEWLRASGYDVVEARELGSDPGDSALLAIATGQKRILITIDTDFGQIIFQQGQNHCGIIRLPDVPAARRIQIMEQVLAGYAKEMAQGAVITVRGDRIRISYSRS